MWTEKRSWLTAGAVLLAGQLLAAGAVAQGVPPAGPRGGEPLGSDLSDAAAPEAQVDPAIQSLIDEAERTRPVPNALITALAMGDGDPQQMIDSFLGGGNATPREVAVRAVALSLAVGRDPRLADPERRFALNQTINDGMSRSLGAPRILKVEVAAGFAPAEGSFAWDLGGLTTPVAEGFEQLTPYSTQVGGLGLQDRNAVGGGEVLQDVIENLQSLSLEVPNGQYRLILLTAEQLAAGTQSPFGESFTVNGVEYFLGKSSAGDWYDTAFLGGADGGSQGAVSYGAAGLSIVVEVGNGRLDMRFSGGPGGLGSMLSGIIMEPVGLPSRLDVSRVRGPRRTGDVAEGGPQGGQQPGPQGQPLLALGDLSALIELEFQVQAAITLVSGISPAAGPGVAPTQAAAPETPAPPFVSPVGVSPAS